MISKIIKYCVCLATMLFSAGCSVENNGNCGQSLSVRIRPVVMEVKSPEYTEPETDPIYAYAFDPTHSLLGVYEAADVSQGVFTYNLPDETDYIVFTNLTNSDDIAVSFTFYGLKFNPQQSTTKDIVCAVLPIADTVPDNVADIHLERLVSKLSAKLIIKDLHKNPLETSTVIRAASIGLSPHLASIEIGKEEKYSHTSKDYCIYTEGPAPTEGKTEYRICSDISILSEASEENTTLNLVLENNDGTQSKLRKQLNYAILPNKHYILTISIVMDEVGFGFDIEEIIKEEIDVELN